MKKKMEWECELTAEGNLQRVYTIWPFKGKIHNGSYKMCSKAYMNRETALKVIDDFVENHSGTTTKNDWYLLGFDLCKKYNEEEKP